MKSSATQFKALRKALGLTQKQIAEKMDMAQGTITDIERGKCGCSNRILDILFTEYKINPNWFFLGLGDMFISETNQMEALIYRENIENHPGLISLLDAAEAAFSAYNRIKFELRTECRLAGADFETMLEIWHQESREVQEFEIKYKDGNCFIVPVINNTQNEINHE